MENEKHQARVKMRQALIYYGDCFRKLVEGDHEFKECFSPYDLSLIKKLIEDSSNESTVLKGLYFGGNRDS
ncbi:MAG: hypothetical protein SNF33_05265 [Candidatus Algichlamydia australiensis]|nr:hypothetical protein [Chlamydiales bacterium]